jgi:nitronate monooxygenase
VAQGSEAGGHGALRGTLTLVPEVADLCAREEPETLVLAAGGIADGRGLAAALMLGADGVLMGSRFWASREALVPEGFHRAALAAAGDATLRTRAVDVVRRLEWPREFTARVLRNRFTERWHGREDALSAVAVEEGPRYARAFETGDAEHGGVFVGEAVGLMHDVPAAGEIVVRTVAEAAARLEAGAAFVAG